MQGNLNSGRRFWELPDARRPPAHTASKNSVPSSTRLPRYCLGNVMCNAQSRRKTDITPYTSSCCRRGTRFDSRASSGVPGFQDDRNEVQGRREANPPPCGSRQPGDRLESQMSPLRLRDFLLWPVSRINKTAWSVSIVAALLGVLQIRRRKAGSRIHTASRTQPAILRDT